MEKHDFDDSNNSQDRLGLGFEESKKEPMGIRKRLILGIGAAVLVCALGLALPALLEAVDLAPAETQPASESDTASAAPSAVHSDASGMLSVTAYAAEWKETVMQPGVSIALNEYSPAQSDVPGLPFIISISDGSADINADGIRVDVDAGTIITWESPDYTVRQRGKTYVCSSGSTIYWSPLDAQDTVIPRCEMTVTAYTTDDEAVTQKIIISQTENFNYTAELANN